ncbi:hypothetical protein [Desulfallas thermosapovorans]|uniref:Uncharacterized protein n=1 Tax=Desulfallas thermosapovorans DSM 6562 TaxID=1121431 RepID=A0A5S4ZV59_9FIRM|nr:hypothetical protein [Desulfallas thermosapovorans]TYO96894.1 hypothetical protein LX24_00704 [Desulfallas thermosapovorans DSM 6562]
MGLQIKNPGMLNKLEEIIYNIINLNIPLGFFALSVISVVIIILIFHYINKRFSPGNVFLPGLIVGKDNRLSISKLQGVLWTIVAIISYITLKLINAYCLVPMETQIPPNLLILMGLNYTTLVLAKGITGYSANKGGIKTVSTKTSFADFYTTDDDNKVDLMKFQMLIWTIAAVVVYFAHFFAQFHGDVSIIGFTGY